jgi:hypothetical protein
MASSKGSGNQMTAGRLRHVVTIQAPFVVTLGANAPAKATIAAATIPSGEVVPPWTDAARDVRAEVRVTGASKEIIADQSVMLVTGTITHRFFPALKANMQYLWTDFNDGEPTTYTLRIEGILWDPLKIWHMVSFKQRSW